MEFIYIIGFSSGAIILVLGLIVLLLCIAMIVLKGKHQGNTELMHTYDAIPDAKSHNAVSDTIYDTINPQFLEMSNNEAYFKLKLMETEKSDS